MATRFFLDTEFSECGPRVPIQLISIGIVSEDGREFYAENSECDWNACNSWVKENVFPHLSGPRYTLATIATRIREFIGNAAPEFWGYYADYDWVVFCQIFGAMIDLPEGWPMFCLDLKQLCIEQGNPNLPKQQSTEHHALNDARWNKAVYNFLTRLSGLICDIRERAERNNP